MMLLSLLAGALMPLAVIATEDASAVDTAALQPTNITLGMEPANVTIGLAATNITLGEVLPPSRDPWYQPPDHFHFSQQKNGAILRIRSLPDGILAKKLGQLSKADQILYRTSDGHGLPTWTVATVLVPRRREGWKPAFISYQMPYDTAWVDASPSYQLATAGEDVPYHLLDRILAKGWHVILPDYQGPIGAFAAGRRGGHAVLDAIRAVRSVSGTRYRVRHRRAQYAAWGYSGGALATTWAYKRRVPYAKELGKQFSTYVIGGLPADLPKTLRSLDGSANAGVALSAIAGLMSEYPVFNASVRAHAKTTGPFNVTVFDTVRTQSAEEARVAYAQHNLGDYFHGGLGTVVTQLGNAPFKDHISLRSPPKWDRFQLVQSVMFYHAVQDEVAPIKDMDDMVRHWCSKLQRLDYRRLHQGGHHQVDAVAEDIVLLWILRQFRHKFRLPLNGVVRPSPLFCKVRQIGPKK